VDNNDYPIKILDFTADEYPHHGNDPRKWAWEFLRRNGRYQRLWDILNSLDDELYGAWEGNSLCSGRFFIDHGLFAEPEPIFGETTEEYLSRTDSKGEIYNFRTYLEETFKLHPEPINWRLEVGEEFPFFTTAFSPDEPAPWRLTGSMSFEAEVISSQLSDLDNNIGDDLFTFAFDASKSIEPQLDEVRFWLKHQQEENRLDGKRVKKKARFQPNMAERYLRILDGIAIGKDDDVIRDHLHMADDDSRKGYLEAKKKAIELRDETYWQI